ncbi:DUF1203 domain-containing protein [Aquimarina gracilis]|uniref:DUF1203 domain-containing protein n=1 Tax=Aquimarina gracilis TaxID=874422 RepID=A0ABU5ZYJ8_9FLAO|nr:DUF1203 domain-containing protein [Aquimarina gracilis]MEB3346973.1 DUF1203 domain-containing protein [Aquimarina gracilis]
MIQFKIVPLSKEYASKIRATMVDEFGNEVVSQTATGFGPCRVSLKPFQPRVDTRLLLSHKPFCIDNAFAQSGPIFINKKEVEPYADINRFPPEIKVDKQNFPLTLIGYDQRQNMIFTRLVGEDDVDVLISEIFQKNEEIAYLHARNAEAGCFICKIERVKA